MPMPQSPPASPLGAAWSSRLESLQSALSRDPGHVQAWRWRIQVKVLTFLVSRYGACPNLDRQEQRPPTPVVPPDILDSAHGKPLRSHQAIRKSLHHIEEGNPHWPAGSGITPPAPYRPLEVQYMFADVVNLSKNRPLLRWLPLTCLIVRSIGYFLLMICVAAPSLWLVFMIVDIIVKLLKL
jgi:hypothetical protein